MGKHYYLQEVLEECKCIVKEKRISKFFNDELEISSDKSDYYDDFYEEASDTISNA